MPNQYVNKVISNGVTKLDLTSDTVTADKLAQGYTAHDASGQAIVGTMTGGGGTGGVTQDQDGYIVLPDTGGGGGQYAWLGSGAEKVSTIISRTINLQDDTGYDSWTASTTATELIAADTDPYYSTTISIADYDYCIVTRGYIEPVYVSGTPATYRTHRVCQYHVNYWWGYPNSNTTTDIQNDVASQWTSASFQLQAQYYYNSSGAVQSRIATQCGPLYMNASPTIGVTNVSGAKTLTYKFPAFNAKCDTSRFTTERKTQVDSANTNYTVTVDLYRVPHGNGLMSHWVSEMCADMNAV